MPEHSFAPLRGRIETLVVASRALEGNLLGDPATRQVALYLPEEYDRATSDYPLLVDLAPFTGSGLKRVAWRAFGESVPQRLERLRATGRMGPVIAAFPDGFTSLGGNQYVDTPVLGRWEAFLLDELIPLVEARYRVRRGAAHRAVLGKSSGGYGALIQGLRHGECWAAVACHSGDVGFDVAYRRDLCLLADALAPHGGEPERFFRAVRAAPKVEGREWQALMLLALAASYDPDPAAPLGLRLPIDPFTAALDEERWTRWLAHDPLHLIDRAECRASLARLRRLYLDCGSRDPFFLHYGARAFVRKLAACGIPHRYEEFADGHSGIDYRLDESLPWLYAALDPA